MREIRKPKRGLKIWIVVFLIWLVIFLGAAQLTDFQQTMQKISNIDLRFIIAAIGVFAGANLLAGLDWYMLVRFLKIKVRFRQLFQIMLAGFFMDDVLPTIAPGGEIAMGYVLHKKTKTPFPKTLASVVMYIISWFVGFICFAGVILFALLLLGKVAFELAAALLFFLVIFAAIFALIIYLALHPKACKKIVDSVALRVFSLLAFLTRSKRKKSEVAEWIDETIDSFHKTIKLYFKRSMVLLLSCINMFLYHFLLALVFYFVLLAFHIPTPFGWAALIFIVVNLVSLISMVPGQLGVFEILSIMLISFASTPIDAILVTSIYRLINYWSIVFLGGICATKLGLESLSQGSK